MINVGIVGFGLSGSVFHAPFLEALDEYKICKICSSQEATVKEKYPDVTVIKTVEELVTDETIDLIVVCTPNQFHYTYAKLALENDKHVVVEKPFTSKLSEAQELVELAKSKNKIISVYHNRRFDGDFMGIKKIIEHKSIGDIVYFESHFDRFQFEKWENWRDETDHAGGVFWDLAPHLIDQAVQLFGKPEKIFADITKFKNSSNNDDYFHIILHYPKTRAVLQASTLALDSHYRFIVHGTEGSFRKKGMDPQEQALKVGVKPKDSMTWISEPNDAFLSKEDGMEQVPIHPGSYHLFYKQLAMAINNGEQPPVTTDEALEVMKYMELCLQAANENKVVSV